MKENNSIALIVAYYLSKYDKKAYERLGYSSRSATLKEISGMLEVNPNTLKNMQDEFDPLHDNSRAGWYQRPLRPSRAKVVEAFQDMDEEELGDFVLGIISNHEFASSDDVTAIIGPIARIEKMRKGNAVYIIRGPTGRKAEEAFIHYHFVTGKPMPGILKDVRDDGCGYDFEIVNSNQSVMIEVKGLDGSSGGISFTSKEWEVAQKAGDSYYLAIVRNLSEAPSIDIVQNPASVFKPRKSVFTTVQVRWNLTDSDLENRPSLSLSNLSIEKQF